MIELAHFSHRAYATGEGALEDKLVNLAGFLMIDIAGFLTAKISCAINAHHCPVMEMLGWISIILTKEAISANQVQFY